MSLAQLAKSTERSRSPVWPTSARRCASLLISVLFPIPGSPNRARTGHFVIRSSSKPNRADIDACGLKRSIRSGSVRNPRSEVSGETPRGSQKRRTSGAVGLARLRLLPSSWREFIPLPQKCSSLPGSGLTRPRAQRPAGTFRKTITYPKCLCTILRNNAPQQSGRLAVLINELRITLRPQAIAAGRHDKLC